MFSDILCTPKLNNLDSPAFQFCLFYNRILLVDFFCETLKLSELFSDELKPLVYGIFVSYWHCCDIPQLQLPNWTFLSVCECACHSPYTLSSVFAVCECTLYMLYELVKEWVRICEYTFVQHQINGAAITYLCGNNNTHTYTCCFSTLLFDIFEHVDFWSFHIHQRAIFGVVHCNVNYGENPMDVKKWKSEKNKKHHKSV